MNNKRVAFLGLILLVIVTGVTSTLVVMANYFTIGSFFGIYDKEDVQFLEKFIAYKNLLEENYYNDIDKEELYNGALEGMAYSLKDPYTLYLDESANEELTTDISGAYEGIGIYVSQSIKDNSTYIVSVMEGSPAKSAGLMAGDKIIKVNNVVCEEENLTDIIKEIRNSVGQEVSLNILRDETEFTKKVTCKEIKLETVESEVLENNIGYIKITKFAEGTADSFFTEYDKLKSKNIKSIIIDLRNNGGGVYDEVIDIAKKIVPKGLIVYTEDKNGKKEEEYSTSSGIDVPLVVLTNQLSASASEVLAGAVKDRKCGTLIGEKTYGKGVVQAVYTLSDKTALKVTVSKYYTPNGVCIDGVGITPDIEVKSSKESDKQLDAALNLLNK